MTIFKDSHHFSGTLGDVWRQSLMTVFNDSAFFERTLRGRFRGKKNIISKRPQMLFPLFVPLDPIFFFVFLHCRTSARHGRSTTGISMWLRSNFPKRKKPTTNPPNKTKQATPTHKPRHGPGKSVREICKLSETRWNIRAPLGPHMFSSTVQYSST